jgi:hypothetical protein
VARVARTWLSLTVELVEGGGYRYWPRPGRVFAAARKHTFAELATAIDVSFGRWNLAHPWQFELEGNVYVAPGDPAWESGESDRLLPETSRLSRLATGDVFLYQFDASDPWLHVCRVGETRIDPLEEFGESPAEPTAYDGWGILPDQYLRRFEGDDGEHPMPVDLRNQDLPPLRPWWGPRTAAAPPPDAGSSAAAPSDSDG